MGTRDKALRLQRRTSILHFVRRAISQSKAQVAVMHGTSGLVAMTSASHAEGRQFDPGLVYIFFSGATGRRCAAADSALCNRPCLMYVPRRCGPDRLSARPVTEIGSDCDEKEQASAEWRSG